MLNEFGSISKLMINPSRNMKKKMGRYLNLLNLCNSTICMEANNPIEKILLKIEIFHKTVARVALKYCSVDKLNKI
jgi:hypothetical protein